MDMDNLIKINVKKFNIFTLISLLSILVGFLLWIWWGTQFGVWYDIGIYSVTILFILAGIVGTVLSLYESKTEE